MYLFQKISELTVIISISAIISSKINKIYYDLLATFSLCLKIKKKRKNKSVKSKSYTSYKNVKFKEKYIKPKKNHKMKKKFFLPFFVLHIIEKQVYKLKFLENKKIYDLFHVLLLK